MDGPDFGNDQLLTGERTLPHDLNAEKSVLGAVLIDDKAFVDASELIAADDFFRDAHKRIWKHMGAIFEGGGIVDFVTLTSELRRVGELDEVGGPAYISSLADGVPRTGNVAHYAKLIREQSARRRLIFAANKVLVDAFEGEKRPAAIVAESSDILLGIAESSSGYRPISSLTTEVIDTMDATQAKQGMTGVQTGFFELDDKTCGLQPGDLIVVAARPSIGKTALVLNIAQHVGLAGGTVGFVSLEMSARSLYTRLLTSEARVDAQRFRKGELRQVEQGRIADAMSKLTTANIFIDDAGEQTPTELRARAKRLQREHGLSLLIVDYIQLMTIRGQQYQNRQQEVSAISRSLKAIAKDLNVPVVALSQLSRAPEARKDKKPQVADLRESGAIEQDADVVILIHREEHYERTEENDGVAELIIGKQRNGPVGTVKVAFISQYTKFENLALA